MIDASAAGIQATFIFVVGSLDMQMQNEKELIGLASAKGGGAVFYFCGSYYKSEIIAHRMSSGERPWIR